MSVTLIVGILGTSFLLLYFTYHLNQAEHPLLRTILVLFAFINILLIPKVLFDNQTVCETVVANSTVVNTTQTHYDYETYCYEVAGTTSTTFMKIIYWLFRIFATYIIIYTFFAAIKEMWGLHKKGRL